MTDVLSRLNALKDRKEAADRQAAKKAADLDLVESRLKEAAQKLKASHGVSSIEEANKQLKDREARLAERVRDAEERLSAL